MRDIIKYIEMNKDETTYQTLWLAKTVLKIYSCKHLYKKEESSQSNNLTSHLRKLEKEEPTKPKAGRREEIIKIRVKINKTENKKKNREY